MNFYSEDIINQIIDCEPPEKIIDEIDYFHKCLSYLLCMYTLHTIHYPYVKRLTEDKHVKTALYCMDTEFLIFNCPTLLMYRKSKYKEKNELHYYILLISTKRTYRNQGYASKLLDGFRERIQKENEQHTYDKIKMILSSTEDAVLFYESYGFRWTRESLSDYPRLMEYEKYDNSKEYYILELCV